MLKANERIDDLMYKGLSIIQSSEGYCFTQDSILLSHFVSSGIGETLIDLGTGSGILAILAAKKTQAGKIFGIEIQERLADMAVRSVILNKLEDKITIVKGKMQEAHLMLGQGIADAVCTNPPYLKKGKQQNGEIDICRAEIAVTLREVLIAAEKLLKFGGDFYMVHRADRLTEIMSLMRKVKIEPKKLIPIQPTQDKEISTIIIIGKKGGKPSLRFCAPIVVYDTEGNMSETTKKIYNLV